MLKPFYPNFPKTKLFASAGTAPKSFAETRQYTASGATQQIRVPQVIRKDNTSPPSELVLARLSTTHILRNILLGSVFTNRLLFRTSMGALSQVANPQSKLLYPENSWMMKALMRRTIYDHFCAGTTPEQVARTVASMKAAGYSGVILIPTREIIAGMSNFATATNEAGVAAREQESIRSWKEDHMKTLGMIGKGDYMGMKFTGAGSTVFERLAAGQNPPTGLLDAVHEICTQAKQQGSRIWFDAEQQVIQSTIDRWVVNLMRKHNTNEPIVSNTYQAYLKDCPSVIMDHVHRAQSEGWVLGIKLVRGAYLLTESRDLIHDTKEDTDACYDMLAAGLITRSLPGFDNREGSPDVHVFIAGHNTESIKKSVDLYERTALSRNRYSPARWGQLQGMADEVSCDLLSKCEDTKAKGAEGEDGILVKPEVYKCLQWGSVGESMQFLLRRATENHGAAHRMAASIKVMRRELLRRFLTLFKGP